IGKLYYDAQGKPTTIAGISGFAVTIFVGNSKKNNVGASSGEVDYNGYAIASDELKDRLTEFSMYLRQKIEVTSGNRSAARNRAAGGANASRHMFGDAVDIAVRGTSNRQLSIQAYQSKLFKTVIYYPDITAVGGLRPHVHLDLNPAHNNLFLIYTPTIVDGSVTGNKYSPFEF
ncbi:D-Ala-D-Ala carboxypeptidase family metallohydrolase, partial [Pararcticibacter amylolyticus]